VQDLLFSAKHLFVEDNREEHVFHQHVLVESLSLMVLPKLVLCN